MPVVADIARSWRGRAGVVVAEWLGQGRQEPRALAVLMAGSALVWLAQWPRIRRDTMEGEIEFVQQVAYDLLIWVMLMPLVLYGLAALVGAIARRDRYHARVALFWAWLAAAPAALVAGLGAGFADPSRLTTPAGLVWVAGFLLWVAAVVTFWTQGLRAHVR